MKFILTLALASIALSSWSQQKVDYTGLNRSIPDNMEIGIKGNANFYFAKHKPLSDGADESSEALSESTGFGFGAYGHFMFSERLGIQTEVNMHYRRGFTTSYRYFELDTARTLDVEEISSYSSFWFEIPVYLKFHWELAHIYQGHWKSKSQLGVYFGPRLLLSPAAKRTLSRATTTRLYDEVSLSVENDITAASRYNKPVGLGIALGVDYELWNGFALHIAYYRGLTSHVDQLNGFKAIDNRLEVGMGYRFK